MGFPSSGDRGRGWRIASRNRQMFLFSTIALWRWLVVARSQFLQFLEGRGAVGGKVAVLPPLAHGVEQAADRRAGRDAERGHIAPLERESRRLPSHRDCEQLREPGRGDAPLRGGEEREVAIAPNAEAEERAALSP